jgi:hypothetical protein
VRGAGLVSAGRLLRFDAGLSDAHLTYRRVLDLNNTAQFASKVCLPANVTLEPAFGEGDEAAEERDMRLWNAAWALAKQDKLS